MNFYKPEALRPREEKQLPPKYGIQGKGQECCLAGPFDKEKEALELVGMKDAEIWLLTENPETNERIWIWDEKNLGWQRFDSLYNSKQQKYLRETARITAGLKK